MAPPQSTSKLDIEVLIREVKKRPILWDVNCDAFKNKALKNQAWIDLSDAVNTDSISRSDAEKNLLAQELMLRWKSTRDNFIRTVRKHEQSNHTNSTKAKYGRIKKRFYHDNQLNFLLKNRKPRFPEKVTANITIKPDISEMYESDSMEEEVKEPVYVDVAGGLLHEQFEATQDSGSPLNVFENVTEAPDITANSELFLDQRSRNYSEDHVEELGPSSHASTGVPGSAMNEDEHFFHSMLPSVLKLSATQKMRFRIKVMQAMLEVQENIM